MSGKKSADSILSKNTFAPLFDEPGTSKVTKKKKSKKNVTEEDDTSVSEDVSLDKSNSKNELTLATKLERAICELKELKVENRKLKKLEDIQYFSSFPNDLKPKLRQMVGQNKNLMFSLLNNTYDDFCAMEKKLNQKRYTLNELLDAANFYLNKGDTVQATEKAWAYYNCFVSRYFAELGDQYKIDIKSHDATDLLASLMIICYGNSVGDTEKVIYLNGARESANCSNRAFYTASSNDEVFERLKEIKMFVETLKTLDKSLVINRISACENNGGIFNFIGKTCRIINEQHRGGIFGYQYCFTHTAC